MQILLKSEEYRKENYDKISKRNHDYYSRPLVKKLVNKKRRERYNADPIFRLRSLVSKSVRRGLKKPKSDSFIRHLEYPLGQLKAHIESLWEPWMSWDNHGSYNKNMRTWQIDHIIPQSTLPYDSMEHPNFKKCWSLGNIRPLEAIKNLRRKKKEKEMIYGI